MKYARPAQWFFIGVTTVGNISTDTEWHGQGIRLALDGVVLRVGIAAPVCRPQSASDERVAGGASCHGYLLNC
ncbi:MAG: hypothetical protein ACRDDF_12635 [Aeromonas sp.]